MTRFLLVALGSAGDVHPFVGIGMGLAERGHRVTVAANEIFRPVVEGAGLPFLEGGGEELFRRVAGDPDIWHHRRGARLVFGTAVEQLDEGVRQILDWLGDGEAVLVGSSLAFAARLVREAHGVPLVTVHLQPAVLRSVHRMPRLPGFPLMAKMPRWAKAAFWRLGDAFLAPIVDKPLNAQRARMGLPPVSRPLDHWWHSPDLVVGLFPPWYAPPQPDWPPQLRLTGFPRYDEAEQRAPDRELDAWIAGGEPPVLFTAGSAHHHARRFFEEAVALCVRLRRTGLLVSGIAGNVPEELPPGVRHASYVPFSAVLPRAAALVCHGGIGTVAQGLAAALPQLVVPFAHDQYDNASRVVDLGMGATLPARRFSARRAQAPLARLLSSPEVAQRARALADRLRGQHAVAETCDLLESIAPGRARSLHPLPPTQPPALAPLRGARDASTHRTGL